MCKFKRVHCKGVLYTVAGEFMYYVKLQCGAFAPGSPHLAMPLPCCAMAGGSAPDQGLTEVPWNHENYSKGSQVLFVSPL